MPIRYLLSEFIKKRKLLFLWRLYLLILKNTTQNIFSHVVCKEIILLFHMFPEEIMYKYWFSFLKKPHENIYFIFVFCSNLKVCHFLKVISEFHWSLLAFNSFSSEDVKSFTFPRFPSSSISYIFYKSYNFISWIVLFHCIVVIGVDN